MLYFKNDVLSPSVIYWAVNEQNGCYLKVTVDSDHGTYGGNPGVHIESGKLEGLGEFAESHREAEKWEFESHYKKAFQIMQTSYLHNSVRPIPADL